MPHLRAPELLAALLVLVPALALLARGSIAGLAGPRRALALAVRTLLVAAIVLALADVEWRDLARDVQVVAVLDRSRSIPDAAARDGLAAVEALRAGAGPGRRARLVVFGGDAAVEATLAPDRPPASRVDPPASLIDPWASDLEAGLRRGLDALDPDARGRLLLLSDGRATRGDALRAVAAARSRGVPVDVAPLAYRLETEVMVERLVTPRSVRPREPYEVRVVVEATAPAAATLHLWREGALLESRDVRLAAGANVEAFQVTDEAPGLTRLEATVTLAAGPDARPQNDAAGGFVHVRGPTRVLYLYEAPDLPATARTLEAAGLRLDVRRPAEAPTGAHGYLDLDGVVLDDCPRAAFSSAQVAALAAAVGDRGVGLVAIGGPDAFGAGEWAGTPLEEALPVLCAPRDPTAVPSTALVLVLDRSGSMEGEKLEQARKAAWLAADALSSRDEVGVVAFDSSADWVVRLGPAGGSGAARRAAIGSLGAGGGTDLGPGLRAAHAALRGARQAAVKHVIVLTDGRSAGADHPQQAARMRLDGITVSAVGVGPDADQELLKTLARAGGGKHLPVPRPEELPRVFVRETQRVARALIRNVSFTPSIEPGSAVLQGIDRLPPLEGHVLVEAKPRAAVAARGPDGAPLLALWQFGLGRTLAFTSDGGARWAGAWMGWEGHRAFWSQAVRWTLRDVDDDPLQVSCVRRGGEALIVVDADAEEELQLVARVRAPGATEARVVPLRPRGGGRYEALAPAAEPGVHAVSLALVGPDGAERPAGASAVVVPWSDELRATSWDEEALRALAAAGGGRLVTPWQLRAGEVDPWSAEGCGPRDAPREAWPALLAAAVALLLLDVAVRRVSLPARRQPAPAPVPAAPAPGTIDRLRDAVDRAGRRGVALAAAPPVEAAAPAVPPAAPAPGGADAGAARPGPAADGPADLTARLLAAKRRARGPGPTGP